MKHLTFSIRLRVPDDATEESVVELLLLELGASRVEVMRDERTWIRDRAVEAIQAELERRRLV